MDDARRAVDGTGTRRVQVHCERHVVGVGVGVTDRCDRAAYRAAAAVGRAA